MCVICVIYMTYNKKSDGVKGMMSKEQKSEIYKKYVGGDGPLTKSDKLAKVVIVNVFVAIAMFGLGNLGWLIFQRQHNSYYRPYKIALHDAYIPNDKYYNKYSVGATYEKTQFELHFTWVLNVMFSLLMLDFSVKTMKHINDGYDTVDMMLNLKKIGKQYDLSDTEVKKLWPVAEGIIKQMSTDDRAYFDMLSKGGIAIKDQEIYKNFAACIIQGHLEEHPDEAQKALQIWREKIKTK